MSESKGRLNRSLKLAALSSIGSKAGTLLLRFVSIPIAIHALGMELFGVYMTILTTLSVIDILYIGIGSSVTKDISRHIGDRESERKIFSTAFIVNSVCTLICGSIVALIFWFVPVTTLFGEKFAAHESTMQNALWIALGLVIFEVHCVIGNRARDGYLETWIGNIWGAVGNVIAAILLVVAMKWQPRIEFLLLAVNGTSVLFWRIGNFVHLLKQRPYLLPSIRKFCRERVSPLLKEGFFFNVTYSLSALIEYNFMTWMLGRHFGPVIAGNYSVLIALHLSVLGILQMLSTPAWPALISAGKENNWPWIRSMAIKLRLLALALGFGMMIFFATFGPWIISKWLGTELVIGNSGLIAFGCYCALAYWRVANQTLSLGLERIRQTAGIVFAESMLAVIAIWAALTFVSTAPAGLAAVVIVLALVSAWALPRTFHIGLKERCTPLPGSNAISGKPVQAETPV